MRKRFIWALMVGYLHGGTCGLMRVAMGNLWESYRMLLVVTSILKVESLAFAGKWQ